MKKPILIMTILFSMASSAHPEKALKYYNIGVQYNKIGKLIEASVQFTQAISIFPNYTQAYYQRSLSFKGMGKNEQARKDVMKAIHLGIKNVNPYLMQIKYFKSTKQYTSALLITKKLIGAMPENSAGAYYDQGLIYEEINKPKKAIIAFNHSIALLGKDSQDFKETLIDKIKHNQEKIK